MQTQTMTKGKIWTGRIMAGAATLFMLFDAGVKIFKTSSAVQGTIMLGYPESVVMPIGFIVLVCLVLYVMPRTAIWGALLLTAYLGGAVASEVRVQAPFYFLLLPITVCIFLWAGLYVASPKLRSILCSDFRL